MINSNLTEEKMSFLKKQEFFSQVNIMLSDFTGLNYIILSELFNKYCTSFYGCQEWDLRSKYVQSFYNAWNKGVWRCLGLPYHSHRFILPHILNVPTIDVQLAKRFCKLCSTMSQSDNHSVAFVFNFCSEKAYSIIARNLFYICNTYRINKNDVLNGVFSYKDSISEVKLQQVSFIAELLQIRDGVMEIDNFNPKEIRDIIDLVSTS